MKIYCREEWKEIKSNWKSRRKINTLTQQKIKPLLLKGLHSEEVRDGKADNSKLKKVFMEIWKVVKLTTLNWCTGQVIISTLILQDLQGWWTTVLALTLQD